MEKFIITYSIHGNGDQHFKKLLNEYYGEYGSKQAEELINYCSRKNEFRVIPLHDSIEEVLEGLDYYRWVSVEVM